jgi:UDPglucose 6-dehydrogenase
MGMSQAQALMKNVTYCENAYDCADGADALVIATEWEQFRALDLDRLRDLMACPVIVDLRNIYRPEEICRYGFAYTGIGRAVAMPALANDASLDRLISLARVRAKAPTL